MFKKIILSLLVITLSTPITSFASTVEESNSTSGNSQQASSADGTQVVPVKVKITVTEPVPGADCIQLPINQTVAAKHTVGEPPVYWECSVEKGTAQALKTLGYMIRYLTAITGILGVIFLIYNGILYSMGGIDESLKESSKKRIIATLIGIAVLFLSGPILYLIAPWVYTF